jgi:hypothetical protein
MPVVVGIDSEMPSAIRILVLRPVRNAEIHGTSAPNPRLRKLCSNRACSALSYAPTMFIRTMLTTGFFFPHALRIRSMIPWIAWSVEIPRRPPRCVVGNRLCFFIRYDIRVAIIDSRILPNVLSNATGQYDLGFL